MTSGRLDEGASFAPNGQLIIYATKEGGRSVLKVINSKGGVAQTLSDSNGRLRDPAWARTPARNPELTLLTNKNRKEQIPYET